MDTVAEPVVEPTARLCPSYVHHVPGRLRLELADLKNRPTALDQMRQRLAELPGVLDVGTNVILGSLKIHYDQQSGPEGVMAALRECGLELQIPQPRQVAPRALPWKDLAIAGMSLHLLFDLVLYGVAAGSLLRG